MELNISKEMFASTAFKSEQQSRKQQNKQKLSSNLISYICSYLPRSKLNKTYSKINKSVRENLPNSIGFVKKEAYKINLACEAKNNLHWMYQTHYDFLLRCQKKYEIILNQNTNHQSLLQFLISLMQIYKKASQQDIHLTLNILCDNTELFFEKFKECFNQFKIEVIVSSKTFQYLIGIQHLSIHSLKISSEIGCQVLKDQLIFIYNSFRIEIPFRDWTPSIEKIQLLNLEQQVEIFKFAYYKHIKFLNISFLGQQSQILTYFINQVLPNLENLKILSIYGNKLQESQLQLLIFNTKVPQINIVSQTQVINLEWLFDNFNLNRHSHKRKIEIDAIQSTFTIVSSTLFELKTQRSPRIYGIEAIEVLNLASQDGMPPIQFKAQLKSTPADSQIEIDFKRILRPSRP